MHSGRHEVILQISRTLYTLGVIPKAFYNLAVKGVIVAHPPHLDLYVQGIYMAILS